MPYEAVSAYTVLVGETDGPTTVTVHGSAEEAWHALADAVRSRNTRWMPRNLEAAALADRWRAGDPEHRFWQVSAHRLQVMVPAGGEPPRTRTVPPARHAATPADGPTAPAQRAGSPEVSGTTVGGAGRMTSPTSPSMMRDTTSTVRDQPPTHRAQPQSGRTASSGGSWSRTAASSGATPGRASQSWRRHSYRRQAGSAL